MLEPVPDLPWPHNLFAMGQPLQQQLTTRRRLNDSELCTCGCKQRHNHAVSKVITEEDRHGPTRRVVWFVSMRCRNKWEATNA